MVNLVLTERQAEVLKDILDWWVDGMDPATTDVQQDRSHETVEDMLKALDGMHELFDDAVGLRETLTANIGRSLN